MSWVSYTIKYFAYSTDKSEIYLYKKIKLDDSASLNEAYHSLDNDLVIKRLLESKDIDTNINDVELYRKIKYSTN